MRPVLLCTSALLLFACAASGQATDPAAALVGKLGDPAQTEREQAALALRKLGKGASAALEAGLKSDDAEIRRACTELLEAIRSDRGPRIEAFLNGKDPVAPPLPGWSAFKARAGSDRVARVVYLELAEMNPAFVAQLEKNPKQVAAQTSTLCAKLWTQQQQPAGQSRAGALLTALVAASSDANLDPNAFSAVTSMLYQQDVRRLLAADVVARRLVTRVLATKTASDPNMLLQTAYLASNLDLTDYIEGTLVPVGLKMIAALGENPGDANRLNQVLQLANAARLSPTLKAKLIPVVRKLAEVAAKTVADGTAVTNPNPLYQANNACQTLALTEIADEILKPAVRQLLINVAARPADANRFYQAVNLARNLRLETELNQVLQPAVCRLIVEVAQRPEDENRFNMALNLARQLNLTEALDGVLRPAARKRILASLEQPADYNRLSQAIYLARSLELTDLLDDTIKPLFARQAATLLTNPDFNRIQQFYYLSQQLGRNTFVADVIKPAFVKHVKVLEGQTKIDPRIPEYFYLARQLGCVRVLVPLARRAALAKEVPGHGRGMAILAVIEFGDKADLAALDPLLTDTTSAGTMGFNQTTVTAQLRDVVLGGLLFKSGKSLADFGFPYFKVAPQVRPFDMPASFLGFASATERTAAFKKWEESKKKSTAEARP